MTFSVNDLNAIFDGLLERRQAVCHHIYNTVFGRYLGTPDSPWCLDCGKAKDEPRWCKGRPGPNYPWWSERGHKYDPEIDAPTCGNTEPHAAHHWTPRADG